MIVLEAFQKWGNNMKQQWMLDFMENPWKITSMMTGGPILGNPWHIKYLEYPPRFGIKHGGLFGLGGFAIENWAENGHQQLGGSTVFHHETFESSLQKHWIWERTEIVAKWTAWNWEGFVMGGGTYRPLIGSENGSYDAKGTCVAVRNSQGWVKKISHILFLLGNLGSAVPVRSGFL